MTKGFQLTTLATLLVASTAVAYPVACAPPTHAPDGTRLRVIEYVVRHGVVIRCNFVTYDASADTVDSVVIERIDVACCVSPSGGPPCCGLTCFD